MSSPLLLVYDELRKLASARLGRERPGQTLQTPASLHVACMRLVDPSYWDDSSMIVDVDRRITFSYVMNTMQLGVVGAIAEALVELVNDLMNPCVAAESLYPDPGARTQ